MSAKRPATPPLPSSPTKKLKAGTVILRYVNLNKEITLSIPGADEMSDERIMAAAHEMHNSSDNSFDIATVTREEGSVPILTIDLSAKGTVDRGQERKLALARVREKYDQTRQTADALVDVLSVLTSNADTKRKRLATEAVTAEHVFRREILNSTIRALNDTMFSTVPTTEELRHRGTQILTHEDITKLRNENKDYIQDIFEWNPTTARKVNLKDKAMSCLSTAQRDCLPFLLDESIQAVSRVERNRAQHPTASKAYAKKTLRDVYESSSPATQQLLPNIESLMDIIDHPPTPITTTATSFFVDEETDELGDPIDMPLLLREKSQKFAQDTKKYQDAMKKLTRTGG